MMWHCASRPRPSATSTHQPTYGTTSMCRCVSKKLLWHNPLSSNRSLTASCKSHHGGPRVSLWELQQLCCVTLVVDILLLLLLLLLRLCSAVLPVRPARL